MPKKTLILISSLIIILSSLIGVIIVHQMTKKDAQSKEIVVESTKNEPTPKNRFEKYQGPKANSISVLMYHDIILEDDPKDLNKMPLKYFKQQLDYFKNNNYTTLTNEEFKKAYNGEIQVPEKSILITFDDGFKSIKTIVEKELKKRDMRATSFIIGYTALDNNIYHLSKEEIDDVASRNIINFESHTFDLHSSGSNGKGKIETATSEAVIEDNQKIETIINHKTTMLCYPFGHAQEKAVSNVTAANIDFAFTIVIPPSQVVYIKSNPLSQSQDPRKLPRIRINYNSNLKSI